METFDPTTGQMCLETTTSVQSMLSAWQGQGSGRRDNPKTYRQRHTTGSSSLYAMALRSCVWNIDLFMPEALKYAEWYYAERIYKQLKTTDTFTLTAWSIFRTAFPKEIDLDYQFRIPQKRSTAPRELGSIASRLSNLSFDCLSFLCIQNLSLKSGHLMALLKIPNLAVLALEQDHAYTYSKYDGGINDKFMRDWGRAVYEKGAFTKLRVLILRHFSVGMEFTFKGITVFPALYLVNMDSWFLKLDVLGAKSGQTFKNGRWRHLPTDDQHDHARNQNPQTTWKRTDITSHRKMEIIYDFASGLLHQPPRTRLAEPSISIVYGDSRSVEDRKSYSAWFVRVPPSAEDTKAPVKRAGDDSENTKDEASKKRKVRQGKQKDIGSLLGGFA
ncbi:hypothetical protein BDV95DRAFT_578502 [Massariosphaeria phaeospora]|uniref:Uncharacterized protein n=1 Tax=Massariosphaeria phaeospora TaxID=100035 RepID=A0A7C8MGW7_9PLEO|nr:hypothetical protein BDV95DRAFT_578502 [Massariosphaeria phaeospora]